MPLKTKETSLLPHRVNIEPAFFFFYEGRSSMQDRAESIHPGGNSAALYGIHKRA